MNCQYCGEIIPHHALKCQKCQKKTGNTPMSEDLPVQDMYGAPIVELFIDRQKATERACLLLNIPSYKNNKVNLNNRHAFLVEILPYILMAIITIALFCMPSDFWDSSLSEIAGEVGSVIMVLVGIAIFTITEPRGKRLQRHRQATLHDNKEKYYISKNVIGYTKHHDENFVGSAEDNKSFTFFEIDKQNIKSIAYDPVYKEYVFLLHKPVYEDYDLKPARIFRIQDIFKNGYLETAMGITFPDELPTY